MSRYFEPGYGAGRTETYISVLFIIVVCLAGYVRIYDAETTWCSIDTARDLTIAQDIAKGDHIPLHGPKARGTIYLGPAYYYILSIPFMISDNPMSVFYFVAGLNVLAVILLYAFCKRYFNDHIALLACLFFAISPAAVLSSRQVWNPGLLSVFTIIFFFGLFEVIVNSKSAFMMLCAAALAVLLQIHLSSVAYLVLFVSIILIFRPKNWLKYTLFSVGIVLFLFVPYIYEQVREGFPMFTSIGNTVETTEGGTYGVVPYFALFWASCQADYHIMSGFGSEVNPFYLQVQYVLGIASFFGILGLIATLFVKSGDKIKIRKRILLACWFFAPIIQAILINKNVYFYYLIIQHPLSYILIALLIIFVYEEIKYKLITWSSLIDFVLVVLIIFIVSTQFLYLIELHENTKERGSFKVISDISLDQRFKEDEYEDWMTIAEQKKVARIVYEKGGVKQKLSDGHGPFFAAATDVSYGYWWKKIRDNTENRGQPKDFFVWKNFSKYDRPSKIKTQKVWHDTENLYICELESILEPEWKITSEEVPFEWFKNDYDDSNWKSFSFNTRKIIDPMRDIFLENETTWTSSGIGPEKQSFFRGAFYIVEKEKVELHIVSSVHFIARDNKINIKKLFVNEKNVPYKDVIEVKSFYNSSLRIYDITDFINIGENSIAIELENRTEMPYHLDIYDLRFKE